ncbi:MAG: bifunctional 4-hydroxy-2-oxoglutarate aldolase/2-dehydro-3-deoxy-phosphogluconate aldolase [Acidobacteriota bacterium]|nr:bifunctional 4-hydroxy-2-oxoglutarate aldolase/2-dehydro-3-deoxy-phosphogluconate aldolase [Acidobacteriota bacterium]
MTVSFNQMEPIMTAAPVIPVITIDHVEDAVPLAQALVRGGLVTLEITLRTDCAMTAIAEIAANVPGAIVGAGTVLTPWALEEVAAAGGSFCVSPGSTQSLLSAAKDHDMKLLPGAATPTEVMNLLDQDLTYMKFFPAEAAGGISYLKSMSAPIPQARFCPTGGVKPTNAADYLALPNVLCVGGTWVCPKDAVAAKDWDRIEALARKASTLNAHN